MLADLFQNQSSKVPQLALNQPVHLLGIGGSGMSGLAELLLHYGFKVSGSDVVESAKLQKLRAKGATVFSSHKASQLPEGALLVCSTAISPSNPEYALAVEKKYPILHRSQLLQAFLHGSLPGFTQTVGLSGTHGKTTMTGLMDSILMAATLNPTTIAGGGLPQIGSNVRCGGNQIAVAELDESDGTLVNYQPTVTIISNLELDHADHYQQGLEQLKQTFIQFLKGLEGELEPKTTDSSKKAVIFNASCPLSREVSQDLPASIASLWLQMDETNPAPAWATRVYKLGESQKTGTGGSLATLFLDETALGLIAPGIPGEHNLWNAAQCAIAAHWMSVPFVAIEKGIRTFSGMGRRFEKLGTLNNALMVDDYAHHPTEVIATLEAARSYMTKNGLHGHLIAVFQPHRYTRLAALWAEFTQCFAGADKLLLCPVYSAHEEPIDGINSPALASVLDEKGILVSLMSSLNEGKQAILNETQAGDLVLTMGAGDITYLLRDLPGLKPLTQEGQAV